MANGLTRQQLYDRIRNSSKEEVILEEMIRLGFWKKNTDAPYPSELLIRKETELRKELNTLISEQNKYADRERMLADMRKSRMEAAKKRREETKEKRERERWERAAAWAKEKEANVVYLGEEVSAGLNKLSSDKEKLATFRLPEFADAAALAAAMGISIGKLRFLSFNRKVAQVMHYQRFFIPKKSGGQRLIAAPMPDLKAAQHWILENILYKIQHSSTAHGFVRGKSILTNAAQHVAQDVLLNIDLKDFFPSVAYKRVKGLFGQFGYNEQIATILTLICTEADTEQIELDGKTYYAATSERRLPQGAPTSPAITNLICYRLDKRFEGLAAKYGYVYTRYADDMTFSTKGDAATIGQLLRFAKTVVKEEGFTVHPDKIHVMRKGDKREVTGIVVNEKLSLDRTKLRKFRALLHQIGKTGLKDKNWGSGNLISSIEGYASFVAMVKPEAGKKLQGTVKTLLERSDIKAEIARMKDVN